VVAKLAERAAIDPARIALERERRRLRRLIDDLPNPIWRCGCRRSRSSAAAVPARRW